MTARSLTDADVEARLWRIVAPHFVAGLVVRGGTVVATAPILKWSSGLPWRGVRELMVGRGWHGEPL